MIPERPPPATAAPESSPSATTFTAGSQAPAQGRAPAVLIDFLRRLEQDERLDGPARYLGATASGMIRNRWVDDALRGSWLGHALHPLLTDFPLGAWQSASFLDLFGGRIAHRPAQRLVGYGVLAAVPTAASGLAEWRATSGGARRVGVVHAAVNTAAMVLYTSSWLARRRGRHGLGVGLGVGGGLLATAGGYFGGHLTLVSKVATADPGFGPTANR